MNSSLLPRKRLLFSGFVGLLSISAYALEMEPRQWSHLPTNTNFGGLGYSSINADIAFDPVMELEDAKMNSDLWAAKYIRTFDLLSKSARVDLTQSYQEARWDGLLRGAPASTSREGLGDTFVRVAVNLYGAPALSGKDFVEFQASHKDSTLVGIGLVARLPTGDYHNDKLLNLSENRFALRPQFGVSHQRGPWSTEMTAEVAFFTENDDFYNGNRLEQDPLYIVHGHLFYTLRPGFWLGASVGYDYGGETNINGDDKDDTKKDIGWGLSVGYPINRQTGVKLGYINTRTQEDTGVDVDSVLATITYMW